MKTAQVKQQIVSVVEGRQGCKLTELVADPDLLDAVTSVGRQFIDLVNELIDEGRLVEVEYTVPRLNWRLKSFILPAGSEIYWKK
jgi:hypothetical protein